METTEDILDELHSLWAQRKSLVETFEAGKRSAIESLLSPEIVAKLDEINSRRLDTLLIDSQISECENDVKSAVLYAGKSVKGRYLQATFVKGRRSWDLDKLDGYAVAHPEVLEFKKEVAPSVRIGEIKNAT